MLSHVKPKTRSKRKRTGANHNTLFKTACTTPPNSTPYQSDEKSASAIEMDIKYKHYKTTGDQAVLLIHGGCFVSGDETWNKDQAEGIAKQGDLNVYTLDFNKSSLADSVKDIKAFYEKLHQKYHGKIGIIGCSSGGFLALTVLNEISNPISVALVCPVMDPEQREKIILERFPNANSQAIQKDQVTYFKSKPYPKARPSHDILHIIAANHDENVPLDLIEKEMKNYPNAELHVLEGTHDLSFKNSKAVNEIIAIAMTPATLKNLPGLK